VTKVLVKSKICFVTDKMFTSKMMHPSAWNKIIDEDNSISSIVSSNSENAFECSHPTSSDAADSSENNPSYVLDSDVSNYNSDDSTEEDEDVSEEDSGQELGKRKIDLMSPMLHVLKGI